MEGADGEHGATGRRRIADRCHRPKVTPTRPVLEAHGRAGQEGVPDAQEDADELVHR